MADSEAMLGANRFAQCSAGGGECSLIICGAASNSIIPSRAAVAECSKMMSIIIADKSTFPMKFFLILLKIDRS